MLAPKSSQQVPADDSKVHSHRAWEGRLIAFYFLIGGMLLLLFGGLVYRQLLQTGSYDQSERQQTQRRVLLPAPRGNIYDRNHQVLVTNKARFSAVLYLDELEGEFHTEADRIRRNYLATGESADITRGQLLALARVSVVQRYLDQANRILGRDLTLDVRDLKRHLSEQLLVPFTLIDNLTPEDFARLLENLPVNSALQLAVGSVRSYPYGSLASHVLGYVQAADAAPTEDFPGADLTTIRLRGTEGATGLEKQFDAKLQGVPGGAIYRVDPSGYRVNPPLEQRNPVQGGDLVTSIDIRLQHAAELALDQTGDMKGAENGALVAIDVQTGEVLAMASKPDYDLNLVPRDKAADLDATNRKAWFDTALNGRFPPGSTFKVLVSIAGMTSGRIDPHDTSIDCEGSVRIGNRLFRCDNGHGQHGHLELPEAIAESCDVYFYEHGLAVGPDLITEWARKMHLDGRTGIELPYEYRSIVVDVNKKRAQHEWGDGDTAEISIGQGPLAISPLHLACYAASIARDECWTQPTLLHDPNRPVQHTASLGLTAAQRALLIRGMREVVTGKNPLTGAVVPDATAAKYCNLYTTVIGHTPGGVVAGKTGTATMPDKTDEAWFICFAPADHPVIAIAATLKGTVPGLDFGGGANAAIPALKVLEAYFNPGSTPQAALFAPSAE